MTRIHSVFAIVFYFAAGMLAASTQPPAEPRLEAIAWQSADGASAKQAFERLKTLAGDWSIRSTQGWTGEIEIRVISRGSAVLSTSRFSDEPDEGMATVYHLDGDRLVLTHYCEAGNQPRLRLAEQNAAGDTLHFVFDGGGNLPTRDRGHMDESIMYFASDDEMSVRWTWHSKGVSTWMEDIGYRRVVASAIATSSVK